MGMSYIPSDPAAELAIGRRWHEAHGLSWTVTTAIRKGRELLDGDLSPPPEPYQPQAPLLPG